MTSPSAESHPTDLREHIRVVRARKLQIALVTISALAGAMFLSFRQTPTYEGTTKILVKPVQNATSSVSIPQQPNLDTERELVA